MNRALLHHVRHACSFVAVSGILAAHLLMLGVPLVAFAQEADADQAGGVRVSPGDTEVERDFMPGLGFLEGFADSSGLAHFHAPVGTYDAGGPTPEQVASFVEADRIANHGYDADFRVTKVYSIVEIDTGLYATRYRTNQNFGIVRGVEFNELVYRNAESGEVGTTSNFFVDPLWAARTPDPNPDWSTAIGGIGAVAAAAAALAAAAASGGAAGAAGAAAGGASAGGREGDQGDPNREVGFVLQLNARRIDVTPTQPALLEASVWRVRANGSYQAAPDCQLMLHVPEGYTASAERAMGTLRATISQGEGASPQAMIAVFANGPASGSTEHVEIVGEADNELTWRLEPADALLIPNGAHRVTLVADVRLAPSAQASTDLATVRDSITFTPEGSWPEVSGAVDWETGGKAVSVIASSPDANRQVNPPDAVTVRIDAQVGQIPLTETATVPCAGLPELEIDPEELEFAAGCGRSFDFEAEVRNAADVQWTFEAEWMEGATSLGTLELRDERPDRAVVRLYEEAPENPRPDRPGTYSSLVVKATAEGFEDLERHVLVGSLREGLYPDSATRHLDGRYRVAADGSGEPTDIGFRVFVAEPDTGRIIADGSLVRGLLVEPADPEGSMARNAWEFAKFSPECIDVRDIGQGPTGVYRFATAERIPGKDTLLELRADVSVPGRDEEHFTYDLRIGLQTPATAPGSPAWQVEYDRCKTIIDDFAPPRYRGRLLDILEKRGRMLGAEGLAELRKRIWYVAADLVLAEGAEGYKNVEAWANRIYIVLDWANWAGDIAFGVVVGFYAGPYAAFGAQMLKPMLISALIAYREGRTPEQWLDEQMYTFTALIEGKVVDPDTFAKLPGSSRAKGWAIFVAYHFFKEYYYNEKTLVEAIKSVSLNVSGEVLAGWLNQKVRSSSASTDADAPRPGESTIREGDPVRPGDAAKPVEPAPGDPTRPADAARPADVAPPFDAGRPTETVVPGTRGADTARVPEAGGSKPADAPRRPADIDDWDAEARKWLGQDETNATKPGEAEAGRPTDDQAERVPDEQGGKRPGDDDADKTPETQPKPEPTDTDAARTVRENTYRGPDGRKYCDPDTTLEIMRDPTRVREIKNAPPDVQEAFENTRRAIYEQHDAKVTDAVRHLPGMYGQRVKVLEFRTPGKGDGDLNTDRDFRVCYEGRDPVSGERVWVEVPRQKWEAASHRAFAEATGGPRPADPEHPTQAELDAMREHAESHQQVAADKSHMEAAVDMSDQGFKVNPADGHIVPTQVTPNIELVKQGQSTLKDPDGLGRMFETKVDDALNRGHTAEGFAQARKGCEQLEGVRAGYEQQGYDVGKLPPKMRETMEAVTDAGRNSTDPAKVEAAQRALRENGYQDLGDFMDKVGGQFASLGMARKR